MRTVGEEIAVKSGCSTPWLSNLSLLGRYGIPLFPPPLPDSRNSARKGWNLTIHTLIQLPTDRPAAEGWNVLQGQHPVRCSLPEVAFESACRIAERGDTGDWDMATPGNDLSLPWGVWMPWTHIGWRGVSTGIQREDAERGSCFGQVASHAAWLGCGVG